MEYQDAMSLDATGGFQVANYLVVESPCSARASPMSEYVSELIAPLASRQIEHPSPTMTYHSTRSNSVVYRTIATERNSSHSYILTDLSKQQYLKQS